MSSLNHVLAVDLHSNCAVALFCQQGRLLAVGSLAPRHEEARKDAARSVLCAGDSVDWMVSAGTPSAQATWERVAMRQGVRVQRVGQPDWQHALLGAQPAAPLSDESIVEFARSVALRDGVAEADHLSLEEARAICIGVWAHHNARGIANQKPALVSVTGTATPLAPATRASANRLASVVLRKARRAPCAPGEVGRAERFVMHLALALHRYGTPAEQLERHLEHVSDRLGLVGQFLATPTSVTASFGAGQDSHFYMVRRGQGDADLSRLSRLERLADEVALGTVSLAEADARIDAILAAPPVYGPVAEVLAYGACSAAVARLFHGAWAEMVVACGIGLWLGLLLLATRRWPRLVDLLEVVMAICSAIFAAGCAPFFGGTLNETTATLAGLIVLVPGLALTVALTELSTGNLVAGTARLAGALVRFMKLGFGVAVGTHIGHELFWMPPPRPTAVTPATEWLALVAAAFALGILLQVEKREMGWVVLGSLMGLVGLRLGTHVLSAELAPCVAGLCATLASHAYARYGRRTASVIGVPAMLLLVPGSVGYRSVAALMHQDVLVGMQAAFAMGLSATALVAGALLAGLILPPDADPPSGSAGRAST